jgi:peptidyl-dipeptidase Dcp
MRPIRPLPYALSIALAIMACSSSSAQTNSIDSQAAAAASASEAADTNPLIQGNWKTPFGAVPWDQIKLEHIGPALDFAMKSQTDAVAKIKANPDVANFTNTIEALERSSGAFRQASAAFSVYAGNLSNENVRKLEAEYSAKLAAHQSKIALDPVLYARVKAVADGAQNSDLNAEQKRLATVTQTRMKRAGAELDETTRMKVAALMQQQASLQTQFNQNLLRDTDSFLLVLDKKDLSGLSASIISAAAEQAKARNHAGKFVFTLQRPDYEAFMTYSDRRDLREKYYRAFIARGDNNNEFDNKKVISQLTALRAEVAELLGYKSFAEMSTVDSMAKTPQAANDLLERVWRPALVQAKADAVELQALIKSSGKNHPLEGWDWRYYAEQVRQKKFALDPKEVAPYFGLENMMQAAFGVSNKLFGLNFTERKDLPVYHPDVRAFEVKDANGAHVGLFYIDYFARQGKRSGAWMSNWRAQNRLDGQFVNAHVVNNLNIPKPPAGEAVLISQTEATTLFHELGHGLHGLLSNVTYPSLSGTSVPRDYVEFPAQFMEHYVMRPEVLKTYAKHAQTGEVIPDALIDRMLKAETFNQGFATVEFVASALIDQRYHALTKAQAQNIDAADFERKAMADLGAIPQIPMRHRSPHFSHVFGGGYSASYYAYMWSDVLDSDGFAAFSESGDIFNPELAMRLKQNVYSAGNTRDWNEGYIAFRGKAPTVDALLASRGLRPGGIGSTGGSK